MRPVIDSRDGSLIFRRGRRGAEAAGGGPQFALFFGARGPVRPLDFFGGVGQFLFPLPGPIGLGGIAAEPGEEEKAEREQEEKQPGARAFLEKVHVG